MLRAAEEIGHKLKADFAETVMCTFGQPAFSPEKNLDIPTCSRHFALRQMKKAIDPSEALWLLAIKPTPMLARECDSFKYIVLMCNVLGSQEELEAAK